MAPPPHNQVRDEHDEAPQLPPGLLAAALAAAPLASCISVKAPGQADRDQPQRRHQAGGAGAAAARRRAADQPEPASLPATDAAEAMRKRRCSSRRCCWRRPAAAQTPAVECGARGRAGRRALRRLSGRRGAGLGGGAQPGRDDQHPAPLALQQSRREQGRQPAGRRHHRRLPAAGAGCEWARPICGRRRVAAAGAGPGRAGAGLLPLTLRRTRGSRASSRR